VLSLKYHRVAADYIETARLDTMIEPQGAKVATTCFPGAVPNGGCAVVSNVARVYTAKGTQVGGGHLLPRRRESC